MVRLPADRCSLVASRGTRVHTLLRMPPRGSYTADRAAALSGVPRSTVHDWARKEVLVPSVSEERTKLWSYADLMGLRLVYWLRHPKPDRPGREAPAVPMSRVREALERLRELEHELWSPGGPPSLGVDRAGRIVLDPANSPEYPSGQTIVGRANEVIDLVLPFVTLEGTKGPDLKKPRPLLRIVPGKVGGEPHVVRSRVETRTLAALARRDMGPDNIAVLYPSLNKAAISQAIDLEQQLEGNLGTLSEAA